MCANTFFVFFFNDTATTEIYTLSLHDALPIFGAHPLVEAAEVVVEDLAAGERRERRRVRSYAHAQPHRAPGRPADGDGVAGERGNGLAAVAFEREPEVAPAVEAHLLGLHHPGRVAEPRCDTGGEPLAQRGDRLHPKQSQRPPPPRPPQPHEGVRTR